MDPQEQEDPREEIDAGQLEILSKVFAEQLLACLQECARGRRGLFADYEPLGDEDEGRGWPQAARLRDLAFALQAISHQAGEPNALCDEFLDLCTMHGESHPGEPRLARTFLGRIELGEVGAPADSQWKPW
ncbi:MAG: hypothetical protein WBM14_15910 [Terracidiphilus sp.]|jgi:hypothetical protein